MAYSEEEKKEKFNYILDQIKKGSSVRAVLRESDMPSGETFYKWVKETNDKTNQYAHACEVRADGIFEEILEIADENNADAYKDDEGNIKIDGNTVQRSRLKIDARKWMLSKMNPKKYGDKIDMTSDGDKIQTVQITGMIIKDEPTEDN